MALRPVPIDSISYPTRVALLGVGIVIVCTVSLIAGILYAGPSMTQTFRSALGSEDKGVAVTMLVIAGVAVLVLFGSTVWAFWRQGWTLFGWTRD